MHVAFCTRKQIEKITAFASFSFQMSDFRRAGGSRMETGEGIVTGAGYGGITCALHLQFSGKLIKEFLLS